MQRDASSPRAYRSAVRGEQSEILEILRGLIRDVAPQIQEGVRYGMLDYPGLANLAAQKRHVGLYVAPTILEKHKKHFRGLSSGKSCLRFERRAEIDPDRVRALLSDVLEHRRTG